MLFLPIVKLPPLKSKSAALPLGFPSGNWYLHLYAPPFCGKALFLALFDIYIYILSTYRNAFICYICVYPFYIALCISLDSPSPPLLLISVLVFHCVVLCLYNKKSVDSVYGAFILWCIHLMVHTYVSSNIDRCEGLTLGLQRFLWTLASEKDSLFLGKGQIMIKRLSSFGASPNLIMNPA